MKVYLLGVGLLLGLLWTSAHANLKNPFDFAECPGNPCIISGQLESLEDKDHSLDEFAILRHEIQNKFVRTHNDAADVNLGHTQSTHWFRLVVANSHSAPAERIFEIAYAPLTHVELFRNAGDRLDFLSEAGTGIPFAARAIPYRNPSFRLSLAPKTQEEYYLRITSISALIVPAQLWSIDAFYEHVRRDDALHAFYFGIATAIAAFNILLFLRLRELTYLAYSSFVVLFALGIAAQLGLIHQYFWPDAENWPDRINYILFSLALAAYFVFTQRLLDTAKTVPRINPWLSRGATLFVITGSILGVSLPFGAKLALMAYVSGVAFLLAVGVIGAVRAHRAARLFLLANGALFSGVAVTTLRGLGIAPTNMVTVHAMQWGSAIEMILLAFALADRFIRLKEEAAQAQKALLASRNDMVAMQAAAIRDMKASEQVLERRIRERTVQLEEMNSRLERISRTDALTGLANRRHFDEALSAECNRAHRSGQPLSLALLDVDWFKNFNDRYGHPAGDSCLQKIATAISSQVARAGELAARYGGEEFAFVAPNTGASAALELAQRVSDAVAALGQPHVGSPLGKVTVSIGVATLYPGDAPSSDRLLALADQALYEAKRLGRSRVTASGDVPIRVERWPVTTP